MLTRGVRNRAQQLHSVQTVAININKQIEFSEGCSVLVHLGRSLLSVASFLSKREEMFMFMIVLNMTGMEITFCYEE